MEKEPDVKRDSWSVEGLGEQSSYEGTTEIKRRLARGDETVGNPDERDVAGSVPVQNTPEGREAQDTLRPAPEGISGREHPSSASHEAKGPPRSSRQSKSEPAIDKLSRDD